MSQTPSPSCKFGAFVRAPVIRFLGSLKLAMILLAVLIAACIVGTLAESRLDTAVAQAYIYDAPWFALWLVGLGLNLTCSVLVRYPWKAAKLGFILTHAGIVVLLAGAMIGRIWGIEGTVTLFKGDQPQSALVLNQTILTVQAGTMKEARAYPVNVSVRPPTPERPGRWRSGDMNISVLDYSDRLGLRSTVEESERGGAPAVQVALRGGRAAKPIETWLVLGDAKRSRFQFGPAVLRLASSTENNAGATASNTVAVAGATAEPSAPQPVREKHFVFAKLPDMAMTRAVTGAPTGLKASYLRPASATNTASKGVLRLEAGGRDFEFQVDDIIGHDLPLEGTSWTLQGLKYLPDFRIEGKEAVSVSEQPNNPALVFDIVGMGAASDVCVHEGKNGDPNHNQGDCCPEKDAHPNDPHGSNPASRLTLYYQPDGTLRYASFSNGRKNSEGEARVGSEFPLRLAEWKVNIQKIVAHSTIRKELAPIEDAPENAALRSGLLVQLEKAGQTARQWIGLGAPARLRLGNEQVAASFNHRSHPLEFGVALDKFEVERNEGTQTPAGFKSYVLFVDPTTQSQTRRQVWMNHPASYPEFFGADLLGTAYKFSQASWNPNNLNQTTLQVLRDPGWSLKWIGSLLVCAGLFTMFFLKPRSRSNQVTQA